MSKGVNASVLKEQQDADECARLKAIAKADHCRKIENYAGTTFIFTRKDKPNDARVNFDMHYTDDEANTAARVCGARLDKQPSLSQAIQRFRSVKFKDGTELEVPEDFDDKQIKTTQERFDAIRDAMLAVNIDLLGTPEQRYTCQTWATVKDTAMQEVQIVSEEDWVVTKMAYRSSPVDQVVAFMKLLPDQDGRGGGTEIILNSRELEDCFPDLHARIGRTLEVHGYRNANAFDAEIKSLTGGRREFQRALSEMTDKTLTGARSEAAKEAVANKEGFYESQKGYGAF